VRLGVEGCDLLELVVLMGGGDKVSGMECSHEIKLGLYLSCYVRL
jgi:hypothetical protein